MSARELVILAGRAASGKSGYLFERLKAHSEKGESAILLTEEQSTYEAEKALCAMYGGLLGTQVLSISRFCQLILEEAGTPLGYLSAQGRCMVLRKIASAHKKELRLFSRAADKRGFAAEADGLLGKLSRNAVSPEDLSGTAALLGAGALKDKLCDLSLLYKETELFLADKYLSEYSLLERAQACLGASALAKSHIYVDSADLSGERAFRFLGALLDECLSMTVTVLMDPDKEEEPLFAPGRELKEKLTRLAADRGVTLREVHRPPREEGDQALRHLEKYLYREDTALFSEPFDSLSFSVCLNRAEETELLCERIADVTEQGFRYGDISVTLTDKEAYLPLIRRAFRRRGIPIFEDAPRALSSHAAADLVLSAARFAAGGSMDDVLHIVKSGLTDVTQEEAEQFENHVIRFGLYGSALFKPFSGQDVPPEAETARAKLAAPLTALKEELSGPDKSARARIEALYRYLTALNIRETLRQNALELQQAGENGEAQLLSEVWARLMEVFHQIYTILDGDPISLKDLPSILEEGIFATSLSPLPGNQDRVAVGDMDRSRNPQRKILFVLGANEGQLPPRRMDDGLFSNAELNELAGRGLKLWENTEKEMARDRLAVYTVLTKASAKLFITCADNEKGEALPPSGLKEKLEALFPALKDAPRVRVPYPLYAEGAFEQTLRDWVLFEKEERMNPDLSERFVFFNSEEPYAAEFRRLSALTKTDARRLSLGKELGAEAFGPVREVSASRLETFNECPFRHYMQYGLSAEARKEFAEDSAQAGTFLHEVLNRFVTRAEEKDPDFVSITEEQADALIDEIVGQYVSEHNDGIYERDPLMNASLFLQTECAKRCARAILRQICGGDFLPEGTEHEFGRKAQTPALPIPMADGDAMLLYGKIDRLDKSRGGHFVRIIDYKLGSGKKFEAGRLADGTALQLPLYLMAVCAEGGRPAGMYYMPLRLKPQEEGKEKINMLRGVTNGAEDSIEATERELMGKSGYIQSLERKDDGLKGDVLEPEDMDALTGFALGRAAETGRRIRSGEIAVTPYADSCEWCDYKAVCRFSPEASGYGCRPRKSKSLKALMEEIKEGGL